MTDLAIYRMALAGAAESLELLGPHAIARRTPDGSQWVVDVHRPERDTNAPNTPPAHFHIDPMQSTPGGFPTASAGHRLIEQGWMIHSAASFANGRPSGWRYDKDADAYTAPVVSIQEPQQALGEVPEYETDLDIIGEDLVDPIDLDAPDKYT